MSGRNNGVALISSAAARVQVHSVLTTKSHSVVFRTIHHCRAELRPAGDAACDDRWQKWPRNQLGSKRLQLQRSTLRSTVVRVLMGAVPSAGHQRDPTDLSGAFAAATRRSMDRAAMGPCRWVCAVAGCSKEQDSGIYAPVSFELSFGAQTHTVLACTLRYLNTHTTLTDTLTAQNR